MEAEECSLASWPTDMVRSVANSRFRCSWERRRRIDSRVLVRSCARAAKDWTSVDDRSGRTFIPIVCCSPGHMELSI